MPRHNDTDAVLTPLVQDDKRRYLFTRCKTKEELKAWLLVYLGLDYPDGRVDPASNSDPMSLLWELYEASILNKGDWDRILAFSCRSGFKTASASIIELLCNLHLNRNVIHMAAILPQSKKCQEYVKGFVHKPILRDFILKENDSEIILARFHDPVLDMYFTEKELNFLPSEIVNRVEQINNYIRIIAATIEGTNSQHTSFLCVDGGSLILVRRTATDQLKPSDGDSTCDRLVAKVTAQEVFSRLVVTDTKITRFVDAPIQTVEVLTVNETTGAFEFNPIERAQRSFKDRIQLNFSNGSYLICTKEHEIYTLNGKKRAEEITESDTLFRIIEPYGLTVGAPTLLDCTDSSIYVKMIQQHQLEAIHLVSTDIWPADWVYDFQVKDNHNYFADNALVSNCLDEVDILPNIEAYKESKFIPSSEHGNSPITLLTSTRKYSIGLVQQEIDKAQENNLQIRHWNVIDITSACEPSRHRPDLPKIPIYTSDKLLKAISAEAFAALDSIDKDKYLKREGYDGCLSNCKLFAACKGYLVNQTCRSPMLKSIRDTSNQFQSSDPEKANAQLLCNKPSKEGMIYPYLDAEIHMKTPAQIAKMLTDEDFSDAFNKQNLIDLAKELDCKFVTGMDHGYTHNFAVCTGFIYGNRLFMVDSFAVPELEIGQKLELCDERIKDMDPVIYPDPEDPGARKSFQKHGYKAKEFKKGKGSVLMGINCVRYKLMPGMGREPEMFFLKGDEGVLGLFDSLSKYHWIVGIDEKPTDVPSDDEDDECFTAETEVLTKDGWIPLPQVTLSHDVMAVTENGTGIWEKPETVIAKEYTGDMVQLVHSDVEFTATIEHRHAICITEGKNTQKLPYSEFPDTFWIPLAFGELAKVYKSDFKILPNQTANVYCVKTSTGYFMARTNGKPFVAGNCDAMRYLVMNEFPMTKSGSGAGAGASDGPNGSKRPLPVVYPGQYTTDNFISRYLEENGVDQQIDEQDPNKPQSSIKWQI